MPRLEFGKKEEILRWIQNRMDPNKYECYVTEEGEVILHPTRSTPPITFGYFNATTEELKEILSGLKSVSVPMYRIKQFEWKSDSPIGSIYKEN